MAKILRISSATCSWFCALSPVDTKENSLIMKNRRHLMVNDLEYTFFFLIIFWCSSPYLKQMQDVICTVATKRVCEACGKVCFKNSVLKSFALSNSTH